jgi:hypothetical protein
MAMIEQVLQTRAKQVYHQDVVKTFLSKIVNIGYAGFRLLARDDSGRVRDLRQPTRIL